MSEMLTTDQIQELFDSAGRGEGADDRRLRQRRAVRVRAVDFSRPTKFSAEQERRVTRSMEAFCRAASTRLSAELRAALDLEVLTTTQLNWSTAHGHVPGDAICALVEAKPMGSTLLLAIERGFVLHAIDLLLGGTMDVAPRERRLTEIDWALAHHVVSSIVGQLSAIWNDVAGVELAVGALEAQMETAQVAAVSEPTLVVTLEARLGTTSTTLLLLVPHVAVAPVIEAFTGDDAGRRGAGGGTEDVMRGAVSRVDVTLRAEVAVVEMSAEELLALRPGDLLRLDGRADAGVTVYADDVPVCRARPGRSGRRRAVQVLDALDGGRA